MKKVILGTFNCENLFMRYSFEGPSVIRKKNESEEDYLKRVETVRKKAKNEFDKSGAEINWLRRDLENFSSISQTQRKATAKLIWDKQNSPDIMALIEVENMEALRKFNSGYFPAGRKYPYLLLIDGNDPRGIDVAIMSRYPLKKIETHIWDTYKKNNKEVTTFSRDCLVVEVDVDGKILTLFINHLKSQAKDDPERRKEQASAVARIVENAFGDRIDDALFAVVGDLNQVPGDESLEPLLSGNWHEQVLSRLPENDRWTHVWNKSKKTAEVSQIDYILLSKALAGKVTDRGPWIDRRGLAKYPGLEPYYSSKATRILSSVQGEGTEASDHCPVFVEFNI